jgi:8-oxo-dGTP pyrophosphatase MutT (NUDIX family)
VPKSKDSEHAGFPIREDKIHRIEVHVAGICARESADGWQILAAKRTAERSLFPEKWECGGGMVHAGESFEAALKRQMFEEFGLHVEPWFLVEAYEIHTSKAQKIIPGVRFACLSKLGKVRLNKREFSSSKWIHLPLQERLDWIDGLEGAIRRITPRIFNHSDEPGTEDE